MVVREAELVELSYGGASATVNGVTFPRTERAQLRPLGGKARRDVAELERAWLDACRAFPEVSRGDAGYAAALKRALVPICDALRTARLEEAELHVVELVTELRGLSFGLPAVVFVLTAFEQALGRCAPNPEWTAAVHALGRLFTCAAAQVYTEDEQGDSLLESGPRPRQLPLGLSGLVGGSTSMARLRAQVAAVASAPGPVLIVGPSGTGKELVAQAMHQLRGRGTQPFMAVNCAALPQELIESELFGHERGAFTGSRGHSPGLMRAAGDGTLFLDEVTEMAPSTQAKLLRALEQRSVRPVGGMREWPIRARVLAATNRDPQQAIESGALRADLFYRLCVHRIDVAPLHERAEDIPLLLQHFLGLLARERQSVPRGFSSASSSVLTAYSWPGNVRELRNVVEHSCVFAPNTWVEPEHLPQHLFARLPANGTAAAGNATAQSSRDLEPLCDLERRHIRCALGLTRGNKAQAARLLGVSRHQLYVKLERLGILDW